MRTPKALLVEVTNRCNADCLICGRRWWTAPLLADMKFTDFKRLLDLSQVRRVCLGQYGEPLLYKRLAAATEYAKAVGCYVWTTTNGQLLDETRGKALLDAGLDKLIVSVDHIDKESYERSRCNLQWETVIGNVDRFRAMRDEGGYATELLVAVTLDRNTPIRADYTRFWDGRVDGVAFSNEVDVSIVEGTLSGGPIKCERPYDHLTVRVDGSVVLCCRDCHMVCSFGNAYLEDPLKIFNSAAFEAVRRAMAKGEDYPAICKGCRGFWADRRPPVRACDSL